MACDQKVDIYFREESQEDERDEHCEADERSGRWWLAQSMKMMKMALAPEWMFGGGVRGTRAAPKCGSSSAVGTSMRGGTAFLRQCESFNQVNSTRDFHNGCDILWRRCKVIDNAHTRNAHAHTNTRRSSNSSRSPWIPR